MKPNYNKTILACFTGYIVQAIINNFAPLLFLTFQKSYGIPLEKITLLVTFNFTLQLIVDIISIEFIDKIGYRISMVLAHIFAGLGLISMTVLPKIMPVPFVGLLLSVMIYAVGGGLLEVLVSPVVEACPSDNKEKTMSLLHSFYCWGHVGVVIISTLFFNLFGIENWKYLALFWAVVPIANMIAFTRVPIAPLLKEDEQGLSLKELSMSKIFWIFMLMMLCSGASEQAVSQWASALAEKGFGISKATSDLVGPMLFAVFMGLSRVYYGKFGDKINLERFMTLSSVLCIVSYLLICLFPSSVSGIIGCALTGFSVGIMWPGTFSLAAASIPKGGTALFALLALAGDLGCSSGPTFVGIISGFFDDNLKLGIMAAVIFPLLLIIGIKLKNKFRASKKGL